MVNYNHPPKQSEFFDGKLYKKMQQYLKVAGFASRAANGYLRAVQHLADLAQRRPNKITEAQLREYFICLQDEKHFAYGSQRVAYSGIKFICT